MVERHFVEVGCFDFRNSIVEVIEQVFPVGHQVVEPLHY